MILDIKNNNFVDIPPELNICSDMFDPVKALACHNLYLPYPKSKTYNNISEYYSHTFLKKDDYNPPGSKTSKNQLFVLKRNYAWFYNTLGLNEFEGDLMRLRAKTKRLRKRKQQTFGKFLKDKLKDAVEIEPETIKSIQSEKVILKNLDGSSRCYLLKNGEVKKAPENKICLDDSSVSLGYAVGVTKNDTSITVGNPKTASSIPRPSKKSVYSFRPDFRHVLYNLRNKHNVYTLYSLRQKTKILRQSQCHKNAFSEISQESSISACAMDDTNKMSSDSDVDIPKVTLEGDLPHAHEKGASEIQSLKQQHDSVNDNENLTCKNLIGSVSKPVNVSTVSKLKQIKMKYKENNIKRKQIFSSVNENIFNKRPKITDKSESDFSSGIDITPIGVSNECDKPRLSSIKLCNALVNDICVPEYDKKNSLDSVTGNDIINDENLKNLNSNVTRSEPVTNSVILCNVSSESDSDDAESREKALLEIAREARNKIRMEREAAKKAKAGAFVAISDTNMTVCDVDFERKELPKTESDIADLPKDVSQCDKSCFSSKFCESILNKCDTQMNDSQGNNECVVLEADSMGLKNVKKLNVPTKHSFKNKVIKHITSISQTNKNNEPLFSSKHVFEDQNLTPVRVSIDLNLVDFSSKKGLITSKAKLKDKSVCPSSMPFKSITNCLKGYKIPKKMSSTSNFTNVGRVKRLKTSKQKVHNFI